MKERERILEKTDGGLLIFSFYLGEKCLKKKFKSPFREGDVCPSCHLYKNQKPGEQAFYYLQDFGDSQKSGNCFEIAARVLNMNIRTDFQALLERIDQDLCLGVFEQNRDKYGKAPKFNREFIKEELTKGKTSSIRSFAPVIQDFRAWELDYWGRYGIDVATLQRYHVHSLQSITFTKQDGNSFNVFGSKAIPTYGYFFNNMQGIKVYRPKAQNRFLYGGKLPNPYIFGWEQLPGTGDIVIITGGEKDVLSLASHGFAAITFNSETAKIPPSKMDELKKRFKLIIFMYDSDATGIKESKARVAEYLEAYNVCRVQLPLLGTKLEKDISDFFALGHTSKELLDLIKESKTTSKNIKQRNIFTHEPSNK